MPEDSPPPKDGGLFVPPAQIGMLESVDTSVNQDYLEHVALQKVGHVRTYTKRRHGYTSPATPTPAERKARRKAKKAARRKQR